MDSHSTSPAKSPVKFPINTPVELSTTEFSVKRPSEISNSIAGDVDNDDMSLQSNVRAPQSNSDLPQSDDKEGDEWGSAACEDVARLYRAGPAIRLSHDDAQSDDNEGDEWGVAACEDVARLYRAGPVIRLSHDDAEGEASGGRAVAGDCVGGDGGGSLDGVGGGSDDDNDIIEQTRSEGPGQGLGLDPVPSFHIFTWRDMDDLKHPSQTTTHPSQSLPHPSQTSPPPSQTVVLSKKRRRQLQSASYVQVTTPPLLVCINTCTNKHPHLFCVVNGSPCPLPLLFSPPHSFPLPLLSSPTPFLSSYLLSFHRNYDITSLIENILTPIAYTYCTVVVGTKGMDH